MSFLFGVVVVVVVVDTAEDYKTVLGAVVAVDIDMVAAAAAAAAAADVDNDLTDTVFAVAVGTVAMGLRVVAGVDNNSGD